jgi:DNA-binding response OmpR family regulator
MCVMVAGAEKAHRETPASPWGGLPPRMRVLFITGRQRTGGWLAEAFAADSAAEVQLYEAEGTASGLARLRDEVFDAVLISHDGQSLNAFEVLDAIRAGSSDEQPILVLGEQRYEELADLCFESGADAYVCVHSTTVRTLIWQLARATERHQLLAENRRLQQECRHRQELEQDEATRLLRQQQALICSADEPADGPTAARPGGVPRTDLPPSLIAHYRDLLRAYVMMGSGNLARELNALAGLLVAAGATAPEAMLLHLGVVEETIRGLGTRSARHVMNRADLLILELLLKLAEGYREQLQHHTHPRRQQLLPGFAPV